GAAWKLLSGSCSGQTQSDDPQAGDVSYWCHPLDVHWATKGLQGWPRLQLEVWGRDSLGRARPLGYGLCHVPSAAGSHALTCVTWAPRPGTWRQRLEGRVLGVGGAWAGEAPFRLARPADVIGDVTGAQRFRFRTEAAGDVHVELGVVLRHFGRYGVQA
ncbi:B9D2 protein, partial [Alcedo cyanopectus]|nr:B9D2 protein [Ceyx cyanopectus]